MQGVDCKWRNLLQRVTERGCITLIDYQYTFFDIPFPGANVGAPDDIRELIPNPVNIQVERNDEGE